MIQITDSNEFYDEINCDAPVIADFTARWCAPCKMQTPILTEFEKGLSEGERNIIDSVINETKNLYWDSFIKHVYDTYPIRVTDRHKTLNLVALAKQEASNEQSQSDA